MNRITFSRRAWVGGMGAAAALSLGGRLFAGDPVASATQPAKKKIDKGPPIEPLLVKQFVGAGHSDPAAVKQMLAERPSIVNGIWDWGGGDFETALGGASHMGRPDIVRYLLDHNARMDIFAAAVLAKIDVVKAAVAAFPGIHKVPGPHGISLLSHAKKAGADEVARFIESLG
jgi:hypothetical protein